MRFEVSEFREMFPEFSDAERFPDARITLMGEEAECFLSLPHSICAVFPYKLLTAHLIYLGDSRAKGQEGAFGAIASTSQGSVSVSMTPPPIKSAWQAWLAGSPYGKELWAWLSVRAAGGWSLGGLPERDNFRKHAGIFRRGGVFV